MRWLLVLHCSIAAAACSSASNEQTCSKNTDCPSGFCRANGTCGEASDAPGAPDAGSGSGAGSDGTGVCQPDRDGSIVRGELPLVAGNTANFKTTTSGTFATAGHANGDGTYSWDLSAALTGDADDHVELLAPAGQWWAADFPAASYAVTLAAGSDLLGVFQVDDAAVALLGVVSPAAGVQKTELTYDPPAKVLALPLTAQSQWTSTSTVSGLLSGVYAYYDETYSSRADLLGTLKTPYGTFPVQRVATDLTRKSGGVTVYTKRQFGWWTECFGGVATVVSQDNETKAEFSDDAEIKRIAP